MAPAPSVRENNPEFSAYHIPNNVLEASMNNCSNLFFLSTVACQLSQCLTREELSVLSSDLVVLSDMLANIIAREDL